MVTKVVVVGGSFAGLNALQKLQKLPGIEATLIDTKEYFEYRPIALR